MGVSQKVYKAQDYIAQVWEPTRQLAGLLYSVIGDINSVRTELREIELDELSLRDETYTKQLQTLINDLYQMKRIILDMETNISELASLSGLSIERDEHTLRRTRGKT